MAKGLKGLGNPKDLIQRMQADLAQAQEELAQETVEASAGGGAVKVVMSGTQECRAIVIAPELLANGDGEMIQDLILLAVNQALQDSRLLAARRLGSFTAGLDLPGAMG